MSDPLPGWLVTWWHGYDTGLSSRFIAAAYSGSTALLQVTEPAAPHDTSDVGRCVRLLDLALANRCDWRSALYLGLLPKLCPTWGPLVENWSEIEFAYHEDVEAQAEWRRRCRTRRDGAPRRRPLTIPMPPSRCWWLVATLRPDGYDPYKDRDPHPFRSEP